MRKSDSLFNLVKSLSKSEKANFKKYASRHIIGGKNKYSVLFDAIEKSTDIYSEKDFKKIFHDEKFINNFAVIKKYLFDTILKSMSLNSKYAETDFSIKSEIRNIELLYKKGLFNDSKRILERTFKKVNSHENFQLMLELLKWKKNLINEGVYKGNQFLNLKKAHKEENEILNKLKNLSDYRFLSYIARSIIIGNSENGNARSRLMNLLKNPLLYSENKTLSKNALIIFYHTLASIYESLDKNLEALHNRNKLLKIMEYNLQKNAELIPNYIISEYNMLGTCFRLKRYDELLHHINKLRSIGKKFPKKLSDSDRVMIFVGSSIYELRMYISKGEFRNLGVCLFEIESGLENYKSFILNNDKLHLYFLLCYSNFGSENLKSALKWMNRILNDKEINQDSGLYVTSVILNLILHYEMGNLDLLEYLVKSAYRLFRIYKHYGYREKIILQFMNKLIGLSSKKHVTGIFEDSLNRLKSNKRKNKDNNKIFNDSKKRTVLSSFISGADFDIESWLESKISGISFADTIKMKYNTSVKLH